MLIILIFSFNTIFSLDISYVSQHSLIDLKNYYINSLEKYGFGLLNNNNNNGNIIFQPFQDIDYFYLCNQEYKAYDPQNACTKITNLKANTDNNLGVYSTEYNSLIFLFNEEFQMKIFFDKSTYTINIDNDLYSKCFDFFAGYDNLKFDLESKLDYNTVINIQMITTNSTKNATLSLYNRNNQIRYLRINGLQINYFYTLDNNIKYTLYFSPPSGENTHSMLCMTFSDYEEYFFATYTHNIPIISQGVYKFYSFLEKEWNISSEYYPTTFYFYLNETQQGNCSYYYILNNTNESNYCNLVQDNSNNNLYTLKIYSHRDSYLLIRLNFTPAIINDDCHFGKFLIFNKTATEYDGVEHYNEILEEIFKPLIVIFLFLLFIVSIISFLPLIEPKCRKEKKQE